MNTEQIQGIIRHIISTAGGAAAALGTFDPTLAAHVGTFIAGLSPYVGIASVLLSAIWSFYAPEKTTS